VSLVNLVAAAVHLQAELPSAAILPLSLFAQASQVVLDPSEKVSTGHFVSQVSGG